MDLEQARQRVEHIRAISGDDEAAHAREDEARSEFLSALVSGQYECIEYAQQVAEILQETESIKFCRWCA